MSVFFVKFPGGVLAVADCDTSHPCEWACASGGCPANTQKICYESGDGCVNDPLVCRAWCDPCTTGNCAAPTSPPGPTNTPVPPTSTPVPPTPTPTVQSCTYTVTTVGYVFPNTPVDGRDCGTGAVNTSALTINTGKSLTIQSGNSVVFGKVTINTGGSITIVDGGQLVLGNFIYMVDSDADGYPAAANTYTLTPAVRMKDMAHPAENDCCDTESDAFPGQTAYFNTQTVGCTALYGGYDFDCNLSSDKEPLGTYACSTSGCDAYHDTVTTGFNGAAPACGASTTNNYRTASVGGNCAGNNTCSYTQSTKKQTCH